MFNGTPLSIIEIGQVRNMNNKVLAYKGCFYNIKYKIGDDHKLGRFIDNNYIQSEY